jgi:SAM-dependent methyltransferase
MSVLHCPVTHAPLNLVSENTLQSQSEKNGGVYQYRIINDTPILIDFSRSVVSETDVADSFEKSVVARRRYSGASGFFKRLVSPEKAATKRNVQTLISLLGESTRPADVLVIAGGTIGQGMRPLYDSQDVNVYAFDLYKSEHNQFIADAHHIPATDGAFDAVIVQAALEHMLDPAAVVSEIWRVLRKDGLVYAETPFMQQVHEGAYDFTRFTESGHRYLFKNFGVIDSGASGGPGLQLMWSVDYFVRSVFRSRIAGKIAKLAVFWAQYFDALIPEAYAIDGASGVYFLGRKSQTEATERDIVAHYKGAQRQA